jgi:hypothetical protein
MKGQLIRVSGNNLTFQTFMRHQITLPVKKDFGNLLDLAVNSVGKVFEVITESGKIVELKESTF